MEDAAFHYMNSAYSDRSILKALKEGRLTEDDANLIREFVLEISASQGLSTGRENKITYVLVGWRRSLKMSYREATISDVYQGIKNLQNRNLKQNTRHDYHTILKRFLRWMIDSGYTDLPREKVDKIRAPCVDKSTKDAAAMLSKDEIWALIECSKTSRDRAFLACLYESGARVSEMAALTWSQVEYHDSGAVILKINDNKRSHTQYGLVRTAPLVMAIPYLSAWKHDYPRELRGDQPVFLNQYGNALTYNGINKMIQVLRDRAHLQKKITPHLFRHSRITHLIQDGVNESVIKLMMWGNIETEMFSVYAHLTQDDISNEMLSHYGITPQTKLNDSKALEPKQCLVCGTVCAPDAQYCQSCGEPLTERAKRSMHALKTAVAADKEIRDEMLKG